jgi:hypothetical protein
MTPFDVKFFNMLKERIGDILSEFPEKVASAQDFAGVQREVGHRQALLDVIEEGEDILRRINGGED